jgi:hypothetical protein
MLLSLPNTYNDDFVFDTALNNLPNISIVAIEDYKLMNLNFQTNQMEDWLGGIGRV